MSSKDKSQVYSPIMHVVDASSHSVQVEREREEWEREQLRGEDHAQSRSQRSVSRERWVETMVVADSKLIEYHGSDNVESYIFTIMNMVSHAAKQSNQLWSWRRNGLIGKWSVPYILLSRNLKMSCFSLEISKLNRNLVDTFKKQDNYVFWSNIQVICCIHSLISLLTLISEFLHRSSVFKYFVYWVTPVLIGGWNFSWCQYWECHPRHPSSPDSSTRRRGNTILWALSRDPFMWHLF